MREAIEVLCLPMKISVQMENRIPVFSLILCTWPINKLGSGKFWNFEIFQALSVKWLLQGSDVDWTTFSGLQEGCLCWPDLVLKRPI